MEGYCRSDHCSVWGPFGSDKHILSAAVGQRVSAVALQPLHLHEDSSFYTLEEQFSSFLRVSDMSCSCQSSYGSAFGSVCSTESWLAAVIDGNWPFCWKCSASWTVVYSHRNPDISGDDAEWWAALNSTSRAPPPPPLLIYQWFITLVSFYYPTVMSLSGSTLKLKVTVLCFTSIISNVRVKELHNHTFPSISWNSKWICDDPLCCD